MGSESTAEVLARSLASQFAAACDMLGSALEKCPPAQWHARIWPVVDGPPDASAFWYVAYHALIWTDLYLHGSTKDFAPPAPIPDTEMGADWATPEPAISRADLEGYLAHVRARAVATLGSLDAATALAPSRFRWLKCSFLEVQLYNLRHLQEHVAQLNVHLGQTAGVDATWVRIG